MDKEKSKEWTPPTEDTDDQGDFDLELEAEDGSQPDESKQTSQQGSKEEGNVLANAAEGQKEEEEDDESLLSVKDGEDRLEFGKRAQKRIKELVTKTKNLAKELETERQSLEQIRAQNERFQKEFKKTHDFGMKEWEARLEAQRVATVSSLKKAQEEGDIDAITEAQEALAQMAAQKVYLDARKAGQAEEQSEDTRGTQQQPRAPSQPTQQTQAWKRRNPWFGTDNKMTALALAIHSEIVSEGYVPDSDDYFSEIDNRMREFVPQKFERKQEANPTQKKPATVSSTTRSTANAGKPKISLNKDEMRMAEDWFLGRGYVKTKEEAYKAFAAEKLKLKKQRGE